MEELFNTVGTVITNVLKWLGNVCTALLENPIFQITIGIAVLFIVMGIVFKLIKEMKNSNASSYGEYRKYKKIGNMLYTKEGRAFLRTQGYCIPYSEEDD